MSKQVAEILQTRKIWSLAAGWFSKTQYEKYRNSPGFLKIACYWLCRKPSNNMRKVGAFDNGQKGSHSSFWCRSFSCTPLTELIFRAGPAPRNSQASSPGFIESLPCHPFSSYTHPTPPPSTHMTCLCGNSMSIIVLAGSSERPPKHVVQILPPTLYSGTRFVSHHQHGQSFAFWLSPLREVKLSSTVRQSALSSFPAHESIHWTFLFLLWLSLFIHYS